MYHYVLNLINHMRKCILIQFPFYHVAKVKKTLYIGTMLRVWMTKWWTNYVTWCMNLQKEWGKRLLVKFCPFQFYTMPVLKVAGLKQFTRIIIFLILWKFALSRYRLLLVAYLFYPIFHDMALATVLFKIK